MKTLFTSAFFCCFFFFANAQQILYSENFESFQGYQLTGWPAQINNPGSYPWETGYAEVISGYCFEAVGYHSKVAGLKDSYKCNQCFSCNGTYFDTSVMLITPHIPLNAAPGAWLKFDSYFLETVQNGKTESATILISADSGATWNFLKNLHGVTSGNFETQYVDISAWSAQSSIQLAFQYSDKGEHMSGWMIDNLTIFSPAQTDVQLDFITPNDSLLAYSVINTGMQHTARIFNNGTDTLHAFNLSYRKASGSIHTEVVTNISLAPFTGMDYTHTFPDTITGSAPENVIAWVTTAGDNFHQNDSANTIIRGAYFFPQKRLTIEEGTATWHGNAPVGHTTMQQASMLPNTSLSLISSHSADPMSVQAYDDFLYNQGGANFVLFYLFDRRENIRPERFFETIEKQKNYFGYADISLHATLTGDELSSINGKELSLDIEVTPAVDFHEKTSIALVLTEDSVHQNAAGYAQENFYAGGLLGTMGGFENLPNPVPASQMFYNRVARQIFPDPKGDHALPSILQHNNIYTANFTLNVSPAWNYRHLFATILFIRDRDSSILNSQKVTWPLSIKTATNAAFAMMASVYPNPANDVATLFFDAAPNEKYGWTLTDVSGRIMQSAAPKIYPVGEARETIIVNELAAGIYLLTTSSMQGSKTLKLAVTR